MLCKRSKINCCTFRYGIISYDILGTVILGIMHILYICTSFFTFYVITAFKCKFVDKSTVSTILVQNNNSNSQYYGASIVLLAVYDRYMSEEYQLPSGSNCENIIYFASYTTNSDQHGINQLSRVETNGSRPCRGN